MNAFRRRIMLPIYNLGLVLYNMTFVPRSQIEQRPNNIPPPMAVVENRVLPPSSTTITNTDTEEQIAELNELLVHVLDEISSLKNAMYEKSNSRQDTKRTKKGKHRVVVEESESESSEEEEQEVIKKSTSAAPPPPPRRGIDFSNCF